MMTISTNLRIRLVRKVAPGMSRHQAAAHFDVSPSSAVHFARRYEDEGTVAVRPRSPQKRRFDPLGEDVLGWWGEKPRT
jgi:transposase